LASLTKDSKDTIRRVLDKAERWTRVNSMRFNKAKCKGLHRGRGNPWYQYRRGDEGTESSPAEKHLGVLVEEKLDMTQERALAAQQANHTPGCIPSSVGTGQGRGFCPSAPLC